MSTASRTRIFSNERKNLHHKSRTTRHARSDTRPPSGMGHSSFSARGLVRIRVNFEMGNRGNGAGHSAFSTGSLFSVCLSGERVCAEHRASPNGKSFFFSLLCGCVLVLLSWSAAPRGEWKGSVCLLALLCHYRGALD